MAKSDYVPQHHKLAVTGDLGQDLSANKVGATGKPSTDTNKAPLIGGGSSGSDTTLEPKGKSSARSPW